MSEKSFSILNVFGVLLVIALSFFPGFTGYVFYTKELDVKLFGPLVFHLTGLFLFLFVVRIFLPPSRMLYNVFIGIFALALGVGVAYSTIFLFIQGYSAGGALRVIFGLGVLYCYVKFLVSVRDEALEEESTYEQSEQESRLDAGIMNWDHIEKAVKIVEGFSGGWPPELERDFIDKVNVSDLLKDLKKYQTMPHPMSNLDRTSGVPETFPTYNIVSGGISRSGYALIDMKLCQVAPVAQISASKPNTDEEVVSYAFEVVKLYAGWKLSKFLFLLPRLEGFERTMKDGDNVVVVPEEFYIDIYKGVENMLFEIYEELGEGEVFSDEKIKRKLLSIVDRHKK